jgi:hypothetical protein
MATVVRVPPMMRWPDRTARGFMEMRLLATSGLKDRFVLMFNTSAKTLVAPGHVAVLRNKQFSNH